MDRVAAAVADLGLAPARLERLKTAVSEAAMNAIEYGSQGRAGRPGRHRGRDDRRRSIVVRITDRALSGPVPDDAEAPDIERKLAGEQKPRGWGLFLIKNMVDSMDVTTRRDDPDGDPDDGTRGAERWMTDGSAPRSTEVPDEVRVRLQRRPQRRADETLADAYARGRGARPTPGQPRLRRTSATSTARASRSSSGCWPTRAATAATVRAVGLTEHYQEIFRITRLSDFMEIVEGDAA